jgi:hypothetical protein
MSASFPIFGVRFRARARARARARSIGYTVVEVLSAMTLFAIGAAGVISMQKVTIQGGSDARRFDVATNIANEWLFRFQRDSMFWTLPNASKPTETNLLTATRWLKDVSTVANNLWYSPTIPSSGNEGGLSPAFDIFGHDMPTASTTIEHMFCTQYRLQWIADPGAAVPNVNMKLGALIRVEVRVFWSRLDKQPIGNCASLPLPPNDATAPNYYHFVYATTAIRQNPDK